MKSSKEEAKIDKNNLRTESPEKNSHSPDAFSIKKNYQSEPFELNKELEYAEPIEKGIVNDDEQDNRNLDDGFIEKFS